MRSNTTQHFFSLTATIRFAAIQISRSSVLFQMISLNLRVTLSLSPDEFTNSLNRAEFTNQPKAPIPFQLFLFFVFELR